MALFALHVDGADSDGKKASGVSMRAPSMAQRQPQ
jgi:hypothetical protein